MPKERGPSCSATASRPARRIVIDVSGAPPDDDRFHRTVEEILGKNAELRLELVLCGLRDPDATRAKLVALGVDESRLKMVKRLDEIAPQ